MTMNAKKKRFLLAGVLAALLLLCFFSPSGAEETADAPECDSYSLSDDVWRWVYVPSSLPDGIELTEWCYDAEIVPLRASEEGDSQSGEMADNISISFIGGNEALSGAVRARMEPAAVTDAEDGTKEWQRYCLYIDNEELKEPGYAVFHIWLESEHYELERDCVLRVIRWEDFPLVSPYEDDHTIIARKGQSFTKRELFSAAAQDNTDRIINILKDEGENIPNLFDNDTAVDLTDAAGKGAIGFATVRTSLWTTGQRYFAQKTGKWDGQVKYEMGNILFRDKITVNVLPYAIEGPETIAPGQSARYTVIDEEPEAGRSYTWSVEGTGVGVDPEKGEITAAADAAEDTVFLVVATPSDDGNKVAYLGRIGTSALGNAQFEDAEMAEGFTVPMLVKDGEYETERQANKAYSRLTDPEGKHTLYQDVILYDPMQEFAESSSEIAESCYNAYDLSGLADLETRTISIDGHPARVFTGRVSGQQDFYVGCLLYIRNNRMLRIRFYSEPGAGSRIRDIPPVTMNDLTCYAKGLRYDESKASVREADGALTLKTKNDAKVLAAGRKMRFTAEFANPASVNQKAGNNSVMVRAVTADGDELPENIQMNARGELTADRKLDRACRVKVMAYSPVFHTEAEYEVTVIPAAAKLTAEPAEVTFYEGTAAEQTVKAIPEPDTVPAAGIAWKVSKKGVAEMTETGEGQVTLKPLAVGKTVITATEPGGKTAKVTVTVIRPAEEIELKTSGKAVPGGTVTVSATVLPKNAGDKTLTWALDVDEDVATIRKGQVRISKNAQPGTRITVTCTAAGAPEPVVRTIFLEVAEK